MNKNTRRERLVEAKSEALRFAMRADRAIKAINEHSHESVLNSTWADCKRSAVDTSKAMHPINRTEIW